MDAILELDGAGGKDKGINSHAELNVMTIRGLISKLAEEVGFEPTEDLHPRRFSRPVHSTTLPLLRRRPV